MRVREKDREGVRKREREVIYDRETISMYVCI